MVNRFREKGWGKAGLRWWSRVYFDGGQAGKNDLNEAGGEQKSKQIE